MLVVSICTAPQTIGIPDSYKYGATQEATGCKLSGMYTFSLPQILALEYPNSLQKCFDPLGELTHSGVLCLPGTDIFDGGFGVNDYTAMFAEDAESEIQEALGGNTNAVCKFEKLNIGVQTKSECCSLNVFVNPKVEPSKQKTRNPATGWMHDITGSFCNPKQCAWDYGGKSFLTESNAVAIKLEDLPEAFQAVKAILKKR